METRTINVPNIITGFGILAVFVYIAGYIYSSVMIIAPALMIAGASDVLDGFLARRLGQKTFIGLILDKTRDTLLFFAIAGNLLWIGTPSAFFFLKIMIAAELIMFAIIFAAPLNDPHPDHIFHKIRQGAYLIIVLCFVLS